MIANLHKQGSDVGPLLFAWCFLDGSSYHTRRLVNLAKGKHKSEAYLQINLHGKVPAFSIDGSVLTEISFDKNATREL